LALDLNRVAAAAIDAAFGEEEPQRSRRGVPAFAAGAAVVTVARVAAKRRIPKVARFAISRLVDVPSLGHVAASVRERLADHRSWHNDTEPDEQDGYQIDEDDEFEDEEDPDEPHAEQDDEPQDEEDPDEPHAEQDDEPQDEEDPDEPHAEQDYEPEAAGEEREEPRAEGSEDGAHDAEDDEADNAWLDFEPTLGRRRATRNTPDLIQVLNSHRSRPPVLMRGSTAPDPAAQPPEPTEREPDRERKRTRDGSRSRPRSENDSKSKAKSEAK
jgi:hypothetical protein